MSLLSNTFAIFIILTLFVYYLCPKKFQWICLLCASAVFYDGKEEILKTQTTDTFIELPKGKSGKIKVTASLNGVRTNEALQHFVAL